MERERRKLIGRARPIAKQWRTRESVSLVDVLTRAAAIWLAILAVGLGVQRVFAMNWDLDANRLSEIHQAPAFDTRLPITSPNGDQMISVAIQ
jgi:hypothetical protein